MSKKLSKYISFFHCFDKSLIVLSVTSNIVCNSCWNTYRDSKCKSWPYIFIVYKIVKKLLKATINKKKKQKILVFLTRSKLDSIETKISEALINNQVTHEDFMKIINEERNYRE